MKLFNVFPHTAYLNTEISFESNIDEDIVLHDDDTDLTLVIPNRSQCRTKLPKGKYTLKCTYNNIEQIETIIVEDAIKLGGSTLKGVYFLEQSSWIIVVMKDRTYFQNTANNKELVEHKLTPDKIEEISPNHILFKTNGHMTIFSLNTMLPVISFENNLFLDDEYVILDESEGSIKRLTVYNYLYNESDNYRSYSVSFEDYIIDAENKIIYIYKKNEIFCCKIGSPTKTFVRRVYNTFRSFLPPNLVVLETPNYHKYITVLNLMDIKETRVIDRYRYPITSINGKIMDDKDYTECFSTLTENFKDLIESNNYSYSANQISQSLLDITIIVFKERIYYILKTTSKFTDQGGGIKNERSFVLGCYTDDYKTQLNTKTNVLYYFDNDKLVIEDKDQTIVLKDGIEHQIFTKGRLVKTPNLLTYKVIDEDNGNSYYYDLDNNLLISGIFDDKYLEKHGLLLSMKQNNDIFLCYLDYTITVLSITEYLSCYEKNNHFFVYSRNNRFPYIFIDKKLIPCNNTNIDNISENGLHYVEIKNNKLYAHSYLIERKGFIRTEILASIFDGKKISDAYFSSVNSSIVYKEHGKDEYTYYDFLNNETYNFLSGRFIQHINGYRPLIEIDNYRQARIIDPVTMQIAPSPYLVDYNFISPGGRYSVKTDRLIEYHYKHEIGTITDDRYKELIEMYNFPLHTRISEEAKDIIIERRNIFLNDNNKSATYDYTTNYNFVNYEIIDVIEFIEVYDKKLNSSFKIKIGDPLWFLNYVSFSYNNEFIAIAGRYPNSSNKGGLFLLYSIDEKRSIYKSTNTSAVWVTAFNKKNQVCYYTSDPDTYLFNINSLISAEDIPHELELIIQYKSFLSFSPSGKYIALSRQGYTALNSSRGKNENWGHHPSSEIFIYEINGGILEKHYFNDHGNNIKGVATREANIAFAAFSHDDKRFLSISDDGVVVIRNL